MFTTVSNARHRIFAAVVALAAVVCVASAAAFNGASPVITIRVDRTGIHAPRQSRPGVTTFSFSVAPGTDESGSLRLVRLHYGVTFGQIEKYMRSGNLPAIFAHVSGYGGVSHSGLSAGSAWTTRLAPGKYLLVDDEAHLATPLIVRGAPQPTPAPASHGTVPITRRGALIPKTFRDGTWRLVNRDSISHEFALVKILGQHSQAEILAAVMKGKHPAWARPVGTLNALGPGEGAWFTFTQLHGTYLVEDWLPMLQGKATRPLAALYSFS